MLELCHNCLPNWMLLSSWHKYSNLEPYASAKKTISEEIRGYYPILHSVFGPLSQLKHHKRFMAHGPEETICCLRAVTSCSLFYSLWLEAEEDLSSDEFQYFIMRISGERQ